MQRKHFTVSFLIKDNYCRFSTIALSLSLTPALAILTHSVSLDCSSAQIPNVTQSWELGVGFRIDVISPDTVTLKVAKRSGRRQHGLKVDMVHLHILVPHLNDIKAVENQQRFSFKQTL